MGATFGPQALRQIERTVRKVLRDAVNTLKEEFQQQPPRQSVWFGKPQAAVTAGNTGTFDLYGKQGGEAGSETKLKKSDGTDRTIANVFCRNEAATDSMHALEWIDGGWHAFKVEC